MWVLIRVLILVPPLVLAALPEDTLSAHPPDFGLPDNVVWLLLIGVVIGITNCVSILGVLAWMRRELPERRWTRPSWRAPLINSRDPLPLFYFGGVVSCAVLIVRTVASLVYGEEISPITCPGLIVAASFIVATRVAVRTWPDQFDGPPQA